MLDGMRQEDFVLPCCVYFYTDVCLYINPLGFIEEHEVKERLVTVPKRPFSSRLVPLYTFPSFKAFVDGWFNFYRMLWNSKWNTNDFSPATTLLLLRKYAVQNDGFPVQTAALIGEYAYPNEIPHLVIKFI